MSKTTKPFIYSGPLSGVTLADRTEVMLHPGREVRLDPDDEYTQTLVGRGHLAPVPEPEPKKAVPAKSTTPNT